MAPPALVNLDSFSDVQFRDVVHRNQSLVAPSANIISKLYSHVSGTTANVSAADVVSIDSTGQGQWDLMLSGTTQRLNANTITTNNTAAWSANSIISVRQASTTIRSANVIVGNLNANLITGTIQTAAQPNITSVGTLSTLAVNGTAQMGNLTLNTGGRVLHDGLIVQYFSRTFPTTSTNSCIGICDITSSTAGGFVAELEIVQAAGTNTAVGTKSYKFCVSAVTLTGAFRRLIPLASGESLDYIVEISHTFGAGNGVTLLRLVRVVAGQVGNFECSLKLYKSRDQTVTIVPFTTDAAVTPSTLFFENTRITQVGGFVGIGTDTPAFPLDVIGTINTSGAVTAATLGGTLTTAAQTAITSVGTLGSLTVTNAVNAATLGGTLTTAAQTGITSVGTLNGLTVTGSGITGTLLTAAQTGITTVGTLNGLTVTGSGITGTLLTAAQTGITTVGTLNGLTVGGSGITGTLLTAAQTGITSVGLLASLAVTGNVTAGNIIVTGDIVFDTPTFKIDSVQNRVGILNTAPLHALDVNGNTNVSLGNVYRIAGTQVLSGSALGTGVTSSSLTSVATLNGLTVGGSGITGTLLTAAQTAITSVGTLNGLTVTGSGITGTLLTAAQTGITSVGTLNGLTVTGSGITGTLLTAAQTGITSVGQLASLAVTGNVTAGNIIVTGDIVFDTPTFKIDSVQNRVGILNTAPLHALDVNGNTNVSLGNVYRINGTSVLSATALGTGVVSSSLTSVGTLASLSVTSGPIVLDSVTRYVFTRTILSGDVLGQGVGLCDLSNSTNGAAFSAQITVTQAGNEFNSISKQYFIPSGYNSTGTVFRRLLPLYTSSLENLSSNDIGLDIRSGINTMQLRLVRTSLKLLAGGAVDSGNVISNNIQVTMDLCESKVAPMTMSENSATYVTLVPAENLRTSMFQGSLLTQRHYRMNGDSGGCVGIATDIPDPSFLLDCNGPLKSAGVQTTRLITTGTGILVDNSAVAGGLSFAEKWRLFYHIGDDALVIQRNIGTTGTPDWRTTGVLATM